MDYYVSIAGQESTAENLQTATDTRMTRAIADVVDPEIKTVADAAHAGGTPTLVLAEAGVTQTQTAADATDAVATPTLVVAYVST